VSKMHCQRTVRPALAPGRRAARPSCPISPTPFRPMEAVDLRLPPS
jgi:hypothetical protein